MAKVLVTHGVPLEGFAALTEAGHEVIAPAALTAYTEDELIALIPDCEAVVACGMLTGNVIRAGKKLRIVANYGAGYDPVDINAARECGIPVTNIPDSVCAPTAEMAVSLMLDASRRISEKNLAIHNDPNGVYFGMGLMSGHSLYGRTLGIVGMGSIGSRVGKIAEALGMKVIGLRGRDLKPGQEKAILWDMLAQCDVISLNCPLNDTTRGMIDADAFAHMKPGTVLINTSRGAVIDTDALCDALDSGRIIGAGLDVFPNEPMIPERLLQYPQVVLSPHQGCNTIEARRGMAEAISVQILDAFAGRRPGPIVNGL